MINETLGLLLLCLTSPHLSASECDTVVDRIDGLVRLEIDAGLLRGGRQ